MHDDVKGYVLVSLFSPSSKLIFFTPWVVSSINLNVMKLHPGRFIEYLEMIIAKYFSFFLFDKFWDNFSSVNS